MRRCIANIVRPRLLDVVGQEHIERTLKNAIEQDKSPTPICSAVRVVLAKQPLPRILAKALMCEKGPTIDLTEPARNARLSPKALTRCVRVGRRKPYGR